MKPLIVSPEKFATHFNATVPGAYRVITTQDIRDMTKCGIIGRHNFYPHLNIEVVRALLQYEQLREKRVHNPSDEGRDELF